ncbi:MAG: WYL domain-containing protein [Crocinitomicaceae bacterium]
MYKGYKMARVSNDDKHARIGRVYKLVRDSKNGIRESEIAEILNIEKRTVHNYLKELQTEWKVYKDEGVLWFAEHQKPLVLRDLALEAEEAMVLYLASRLFVKQADRRNVIAETVLDKLSTILSTDAGLSGDIQKAAQILSKRPFEQGYEDIFRTIMQAYLYRRPVKLIYHPYKGDPFETIVCPYLLEPSAIGFSTYIIGHSSIVNDLRTYKIERIETANIIANKEYSIPDDFPGLALLENAWSIFYGEKTVEVILRFHPDVARRVRETNWHPSQQDVELDPEKEGYVILRFTVADTTDLIPWIRTWGANCEVLAPTILRATMTGEARRYAELYGIGSNNSRKRYSDIFGD